MCSHRPVLDTIEMLAMHRKGKKHLFNLSKQLSWEHRRKEEATKRIQQPEPKNEPQPVQPGKWNQRCLGRAMAKSSTKSPRLKLMKSAPYSSCCRKTPTRKNTDATLGVDDSERLADTDRAQAADENPAVMSYVKALRRKQSFSSTVEERKRHPSKGTAEKTGYGSNVTEPPVQTPQESPVPAEPLRKEEEEKKKAKAQRYLNLRMAGWIRDGEGKWVKDENAEFDTDEEEPPDVDD